jgi:hypothetical protein
METRLKKLSLNREKVRALKLKTHVNTGTLSGLSDLSSGTTGSRVVTGGCASGSSASLHSQSTDTTG